MKRGHAYVDDVRVNVVIPTLNEKENIADVIFKLRQVGCQKILIVDGNSTDGTAETARRLGAEVIVQNGKGKGGALRQAFCEGCFDGDIVMILDADGSMDPAEIPSFTQMIESGADIVKGSRFLPTGQSEDMTPMRRVGNTILTGVLNFIYFTKYTDLCYGYMAFRKEALKELAAHLESQNFEIETEICIKAKELGLRIVEVPSFEHRRRSGATNLRSFKDGFRILSLILRESLMNGS